MDFFFNLFIFNWRIIALQYCVGFCHTSAWISHRLTHDPSLVNFLPTSHPSPSHPPKLSQSTGLTVVYMFPWVSPFVPPSRPQLLCPKNLFSMSTSPLLPCKWIHQYHLVVHIHSEILLSYRKEFIWVGFNEVNEPRVYYTKWSKSEREKQI